MNDPYRAAGLLRNPFVIDGELVADEVWLDRGFSDALLSPRCVVQFVGEKGAGKTSHLRRWQAQLGGPYRHIAPGRDRYRPPPGKGRAVFWDEADRIPRPILSSYLALVALRRSMVVIGTHRDLSEPAERAGLAVRTMILQAITNEDVEEWANLRISAASLDEERARETLGPVPRLEATPVLSWRDIGDELHSWAAQQVESRRPPADGRF